MESMMKKLVKLVRIILTVLIVVPTNLLTIFAQEEVRVEEKIERHQEVKDEETGLLVYTGFDTSKYDINKHILLQVIGEGGYLKVKDDKTTSIYEPSRVPYILLHEKEYVLEANVEKGYYISQFEVIKTRESGLMSEGGIREEGGYYAYENEASLTPLHTSADSKVVTVRFEKKPAKRVKRNTSPIAFTPNNDKSTVSEWQEGQTWLGMAKIGPDYSNGYPHTTVFHALDVQTENEVLTLVARNAMYAYCEDLTHLFYIPDERYHFFRIRLDRFEGNRAYFSWQLIYEMTGADSWNTYFSGGAASDVNTETRSIQRLQNTFFIDFAEITIEVEKSDKKDEKQKLPGAFFAIYSDRKATKKIGEIGPTDNEGRASASVKVLPALGKVYVKETVAPNGYALDPNPHPVSFELGATIQQVSVQLQNGTEPEQPREVPDEGFDILNKVSLYPEITDDNAAYQNLAGAKFQVTYDCIQTIEVIDSYDDLGNPITKQTQKKWTEDRFPVTDEFGIATWERPMYAVGAYYNVKELEAPPYYKKTGGTYSNEQYKEEPLVYEGGIRIHKVDEEGKIHAAANEGAMFQANFYDPRGSLLKSWKLKVDGQGYASLDTSHLISGDPLYTIQGKAVIPAGRLEVKEISPANTYTIKGAYYANGRQLTSAAIGETVNFDFTKEGEEIVCSVSGISTNTITKTDRPIRGSFDMVKLDAFENRRPQGDGTLAFCEFDLYYLNNTFDTTSSMKLDIDGDGIGEGKEYMPNDRIASLRVYEDGTWYPKNSENNFNKTFLAIGKYKLVETKAPYGYSKYVYTGEDGFTKTEEPVNVTFTIKKDIEHITLDETNPSLSIKDTPYFGKLSIQKFTSPYRISEPLTFEAGATFTIVLSRYVEEIVQKEAKDITREDVLNAYDQKESYQGIDALHHRVTGFTNMEYDEITTDENGKATSKNLAFGKYYVVQRSGNKEKDVYDNVVVFNVTKELQETRLDFYKNETSLYTVKLIKKDADTGKTVTQDSASYKIRKIENEDGTPFDPSDHSENELRQLGLNEEGYVTYTYLHQKYTTFRTYSANRSDRDHLQPGVFYPVITSENTTPDGSVTLPLQVYPGKYELIETDDPKGYSLTQETTIFSVRKDSVVEIDEEGQRIVYVENHNRQLTGKVRIAKSLDGYESDTSLFDQKDLSLYGFTLYAKDTVYDPSDGTVLFNKDDIAYALTHDTTSPYRLIQDVHPDATTGMLEITDIPLGNYYLKETSQPSGTVTNAKQYNISVFENPQDHDATLVVITIEENNNIQTMYQNDTPYDTIVHTYKDNQYVYTNYYNTEGDKEAYNTYINEIDAYEHYRYPNDLKDSYTYHASQPPKPVFAYEPLDQIEATKDEISINNIVTKTEFSKKAVTGDDELEGATLQIKEKDSGNIIDTWVSGKNTHKIAGLSIDTEYILQETLPPIVRDVTKETYAKASDITFQVDAKGNIKTVTMIDKLVEAIKTDACNNSIEGAVFEVYEVDERRNVISELIDSWMTKKEENHYISHLAVNHTYVIKEVKAPYGFVKMKDTIIRVDDDSQNQQIHLVNESQYLAKMDQYGRFVKGAKIEVYDENQTLIDSWTTGTHLFDINATHKEQLTKGNIVTLDENTQIYPTQMTGKGCFDIHKTTQHPTTFVAVTKNAEYTAYYEIDLEGDERAHRILHLESDKKYTIKEVETPVGYAMASDIFLDLHEAKSQYIKMTDRLIEEEKKKVYVRKVDENNRPISGAVIALYNENDDLLTTFITDANPQGQDITAFVSGTHRYKLAEIETPFGFETSDPITFTTAQTVITMVDKRKKYTIKIKKVDSQQNEVTLSGAQFTLYTKSKEIALDTNHTPAIQTTDRNGEVIFEVFYNGDYDGYTIKETKAPKGYMMREEETIVTLENDYDFDPNHPVLYTISNDKNVETGIRNDALFYAGIMILCGVIGGIVYTQKRRFR